MKITKEMCSGCEQNFYNGNNPLGVKECWSFDSAKIIKVKPIGIWQPPPYDKVKAIKKPNCYQRKGMCYRIVAIMKEAK